MCFLAKFTVVFVQVRSYKSTINASNTDMQSSLSSDGPVIKVENTGVISLNDFHMSNAFFSLPANDDTVSQPAKAWNMVRKSVFSYPSSLAMSCTGIYLRCLPVPKTTQISVSSRLTTVDTARTRTSVSKVRKMTLRYPLFAESTRAFWCPPLHVCMVQEMRCPGELESTAHSGHMLCRRLSSQKGFLPPGVPGSRTVQSCCLPVSRTPANFLGLCWKVQHAAECLFLESPLRLTSWDVYTLMGFSMLMIAAPSNMMTSATGASPRDVHNFSTHSTRSDFVPNRSFPSRDSYVGYA